MIKRLSVILIWAILAIPTSGQDAGQLNLKKILDTLSAPAVISANATKRLKKKEPVKDPITEIAVTGNLNIPTRFILNEMSTHTGDPLNPYKINRDVRNIQSLGLFASVRSDIEKSLGQIKLTIHVKENPTLKSIEFHGATLYTPEKLKSVLKSKQGEIFNLSYVRKDIQAVEKLYKDEGYFQAKVFNVKTPEKPGDPLVLMVGEGVIDDIVITGNNKTKDYVILREIDLRPGSLIQQESLRQNLRRVFNLNYFTDIQPQFLPGKSPNTYKLKMDITERQTNGSFTFGGGYSPTGGFSVFSDLFWDNLFGTGQLIMLKGQFGRNTTYQFKYHNPWMWDKRKSLTMRTWLTYGELGSYNPLVSQISFRNERRKGVDVSLGVPFSYDLISSHRLKYESVEIPGSDIDYRIHSYTFNISDDTRDVRFNPSDGHYYSYALEQSVKWLDNSLLFTRQDISLKEFLPTVENQTIAIRAEIGYLSSPEIRNQDIFRSEWYIIGGGSTVRGYDDQYPFSFGNKRILGTIEYRFLFTDTFQTVLFIDAGNATNDSIFDIREYKIGKGFGIRMNVPPLGPLRLDLGMDEDETIRIHFNIGHAF